MNQDRVGDILHDLELLAEVAAHPTMNHPATRSHAEYIMKKYGFTNPYEKKDKV